MVTILTFGTQLGYGQTEANSATNVTYLNYNGTNFSIQYPASWNIEPSENISDVEMFTVASYQPLAYVTVEVASSKEQLTSNMTQQEVESNLEQVFPFLAKQYISGVYTGPVKPTENPSYDKYNVDGHRVGSIVFTGTLEQLDQKGLLIATILGNKIFTLSYASIPDTFDQSLPIVENIIKSIKFRP